MILNSGRGSRDVFLSVERNCYLFWNSENSFYVGIDEKQGQQDNYESRSENQRNDGANMGAMQFSINSSPLLGK